NIKRNSHNFLKCGLLLNVAKSVEFKGKLCCLTRLLNIHFLPFHLNFGEFYVKISNMSLIQIFVHFLCTLPSNVTAQKRACNTATCVNHRLADFLSRSGGLGYSNFVPTNVGSLAFGRRKRHESV
uniref:Calcitonin peptide-like domain-containing protein n=1 Tax=Gouania willdenowi TaxID=441366 RepID=A0A8C5HUU4_GOUWI